MSDFEEECMKKQPEITAQTKQSLVDAFWWFYCQKRVEKTTIKEIAQKAGYHRGTFYEYFTDVYDLLEQTENSLLPEVDELPPILLEPDKAAFPMGSVIEIYAKYSKYYTVLLGDNGDPAFSGKLKNSIKKKLISYLVSARKARYLRA